MGSVGSVPGLMGDWIETDGTVLVMVGSGPAAILGPGPATRVSSSGCAAAAAMADRLRRLRQQYIHVAIPIQLRTTPTATPIPMATASAFFVDDVFVFSWEGASFTITGELVEVGDVARARLDVDVGRRDEYL